MNVKNAFLVALFSSCLVVCTVVSEETASKRDSSNVPSCYYYLNTVYSGPITWDDLSDDSSGGRFVRILVAKVEESYSLYVEYIHVGTEGIGRTLISRYQIDPDTLLSIGFAPSAISTIDWIGLNKVRISTERLIFVLDLAEKGSDFRIHKVDEH